MESPLDMNSFLAPLLAKGSLREVENLIACSLQPDRILEELISSERYEALPLFLPLLRLKENADRCQKLARVLAEAYLASNSELITFLQQHLMGYIGIGDVTFYCGQLAVVLPEPESAMDIYQYQNEYQHGLVSADKLDLFLTVHKPETISADFCRTAGKYCAKAFMDHFGYSSNKIYFYVGGAFSAQNREAIRHLFTKVEDKHHLHGRVREFIFLYATNKDMLAFARWLLREGYLMLDAKDWESLRVYSNLYEGLQADV